MSSINATSSFGGINDIDLGPAGSVQIMYAKLQLLMSAQCKTQAEKYMNDIQGIQAEQREAAKMIELARQLKQQGKPPTDELKQWMKDRGLEAINSGKPEDWDVNIKKITSYQETVGNKTQTLMVYLQDFIGQYNSYLQGASSSINDAKNVLTSLARGQ